MTIAQWIEQAKANQQKLEYLIGRYHPARLNDASYHMNRLDDKMRITAPNAERACDNVRNKIRIAFEGDPITKFAQALKDNNHNVAYSVISDTWFGVPESTSCWDITGFKEAVDLLDDPPEIDNREGKD